MKKGFTLLELVIVIIIIGVLASLGFIQYTRMVERGRTSEAKAMLGTIRTAEQGYYLERGVYTAALDELAVEVVPAGICDAEYYFSYSVAVAGPTFIATANRCTVGGKEPQGPAGGYNLTLDQAGTFGGTPGYF